MFRCGDRRYVLNVPFIHGVCLVLLGFRHGRGNGSGLIVLDLFNFHELRKVEFGFSGSILFFLLVQVLRKNRGPGLIRPSHIGRFLQFARTILAVLFIAHCFSSSSPVEADNANIVGIAQAGIYDKVRSTPNDRSVIFLQSIKASHVVVSVKGIHTNIIDLLAR